MPRPSAGTPARLAHRNMPDSFLILGCGSIGKRHIANLLALSAGEVVAFDPNPDRRREVESRFAIPTVDDPTAALDCGVSVVFVCSPTHLHMQQSLAAARAGAHIFIEKPLSLDQRGADQLALEVEKRGLIALTGCNFRFHPGLQKVKELVDHSVIGRIVSARAQFGQYLPDWHPWEDYRTGYSACRDMGGGVILDRVHELDYLHWLFGEATHVYSLAGKLSTLEIDCEDTAEILIRLASGAFCSVHLDYVRRAYDCSLEITGEEGSIHWSFPDHQVRWYTAASRQWQSVTWPNYPANDMYLEELRHFLRAIHGLEPPAQTLEDARRTLATALGAKQSAASGRQIDLSGMLEQFEVEACCK